MVLDPLSAPARARAIVQADELPQGDDTRGRIEEVLFGVHASPSGREGATGTPLMRAGFHGIEASASTAEPGLAG